MSAPVCGYEHVELGIVGARNVQLPRVVTRTRGSAGRSKGVAHAGATEESNANGVNKHGAGCLRVRGAWWPSPPMNCGACNPARVARRAGSTRVSRHNTRGTKGLAAPVARRHTRRREDCLRGTRAPGVTRGRALERRKGAKRRSWALAGVQQWVRRSGACGLGCACNDLPSSESSCTRPPPPRACVARTNWPWASPTR